VSNDKVTVTYKGGVKGIEAFQTSDGRRLRKGVPSTVSPEIAEELKNMTSRHRFEFEGEPTPEAEKSPTGPTGADAPKPPAKGKEESS
jgi:hypothetical protein